MALSAEKTNELVRIAMAANPVSLPPARTPSVSTADDQYELLCRELAEMERQEFDTATLRVRMNSLAIAATIVVAIAFATMRILWK